MKTTSPIVDCGVHYVDVMCQMTRSRPTQVYAIGARLSNEIAPDMYNYGQLQVRFEDGSVGWYEAGWGPMMSEQAYFIKDVIGPQGSISIAQKEAGKSADVNSHTNTQKLLLHRAEYNDKGKFIHEDEWMNSDNEPDHDGLCLLEQQYFLRAIRENLDLRDHLDDVINSLKIVLAADLSIREGRAINL
jgi:predicted dehydrogenase